METQTDFANMEFVKVIKQYIHYFKAHVSENTVPKYINIAVRTKNEIASKEEWCDAFSECQKILFDKTIFLNGIEYCYTKEIK